MTPYRQKITMDRWIGKLGLQKYMSCWRHLQAMYKISAERGLQVVLLPAEEQTSTSCWVIPCWTIKKTMVRALSWRLFVHWREGTIRLYICGKKKALEWIPFAVDRSMTTTREEALRWYRWSCMKYQANVSQFWQDCDQDRVSFTETSQSKKRDGESTIEEEPKRSWLCLRLSTASSSVIPGPRCQQECVIG